MSGRMHRKHGNKNQSIIIYNTYSENLLKNIESIIKKIGLSEYGTTISKFYEEHHYHKIGEEWDIYVDIATPPDRYNIEYGNTVYTNVSAYILLTNFKKNKLCKELYARLISIRELNGDAVSRPQYKKETDNQKP